MAITTNAIVPTQPPVEGGWIVASLYSADLTGAEDLVAAVTGKCIYVQKVQIFSQSVTDATVTLGSAQGTGVTTVYLGPIPLPDAGGSILIDFGPTTRYCRTMSGCRSLTTVAARQLVSPGKAFHDRSGS